MMDGGKLRYCVLLFEIPYFMSLSYFRSPVMYILGLVFNYIELQIGRGGQSPTLLAGKKTSNLRWLHLELVISSNSGAGIFTFGEAFLC